MKPQIQIQGALAMTFQSICVLSLSKTVWAGDLQVAPILPVPSVITTSRVTTYQSTVGITTLALGYWLLSTW
jgi:hypothetical protein